MVSIVAWWAFDWMYVLLAADDVYGFDLQNDLKIQSSSVKLSV